MLKATTNTFLVDRERFEHLINRLSQNKYSSFWYCWNAGWQRFKYHLAYRTFYYLFYSYGCSVFRY